MLSFQCLKTTKYDIVNPLMGFISPYLPPERKAEIKSDLENISKQREVFRNITQYTDDTCINDAKVYLDGLMSITKYFPVVANSVRKTITWYSAVAPKQYITTQSFLVELMCTLFNIAALYSQKAVDKLPSELNVAIIDSTCADLSLANGYLASIQKELCHMCDSEAKLPEIDPESILGYRSLLSAQLHFLKAEKARIIHEDKQRLFVTVYMGSHARYNEALKHFGLSKYPLPDNFIQFVEVMSKVSYVMALYYEGYMTREQLEDFEIHGSGKAYFCLNTCYTTLNGIRRSNVPGVAERVMPLLSRFTGKLTESLKEIMDAWRLRRSYVPNTAASFNMRASILKDVTYPELTPSVDFSVILTPSEQKQFAALCSAFAKYAATDLDAMDRCVVEMENSIKEYLYTLEYYPIVEAASCRDGVPEYYKKMLSDLYKTERKDPLDGVIARYNDKRATLNQLMDTCDCEYSNIIRMIGINPNRFAPNIVNYFRVTLHKYIDDNKAFITTMDDRDKKMKPWLDEKASKDFALIAEASSAGVMQRISAAVEAEDCLDDVNKIANTKGDMDDLQEKVKELRDTAHRMAVLHYQLTADFFTNEAGRKTMENAFPSYFTDCQNVIVSCKQQAATWRDYITKLQQMLSLVKSSLMGISHYREKYSLLCILSREDKAYHQLERYHEYAEKCDQSIEAFKASINIMQQYSKCSVCLTQE